MHDPWYVGVADLVLANVQTEEEKANGCLRLATVAARNDSGDRQVLCKVDYPLMKLTSVGVEDIVYEEDVKKAKKRGREDDSLLDRVRAMKNRPQIEEEE